MDKNEKFHRNWKNLIFGSLFAPKAQNWAQKPHFEGILGLLKDFEFHIRILHEKLDKNGKFHRNWRNLIFGSFFAPKAQNWARNPPILPLITPKYKKINTAIQFYTILLCYIRNFIRIGRHRFFCIFALGTLIGDAKS